MAVIIRVSNNLDFLETFKEHIKTRIIKTWLVDAEGDYTLCNPQWSLKCWFRVKTGDGNKVTFGLIPSNYYPLTKELYGVYHGRLAATLLANFDEDINFMEITPGFAPGIDTIPTNIIG